MDVRHHCRAGSSRGPLVHRARRKAGRDRISQSRSKVDKPVALFSEPNGSKVRLKLHGTGQITSSSVWFTSGGF
jgi:hypothetical protein